MNKKLMIHAAGLGAIAAISAAAWFLQIAPTIDRQHTARAQMLELAQDKQEATNGELAIASLKRAIKDAKAAADREPHLEPVSMLNVRLAKFSELASLNQLQLDGMEPGQQQITPKHGTLDIHMLGRGSYKQLATFLNKCNAVMPDTAVTELNLSAPPSGDPNATFSATFRWYTAKK